MTGRAYRQTAALTLLVLLLALPVHGPAQDSGVSASAIVLGMSGALSGESRHLGAELRDGMQAVFDEVNRNGGIDGRPIELRVYDDGYDPAPAIHNTVRLIEDDQVMALVGYVGTPTVTRVLPLLKLYEDRDVLMLFPFTGAEPQRSGPWARFAFNLRPSYRQETRGLVDRLVAVGLRRVALFYQADSYGRSGWEGVQDALKAHGLELAAEATYRRGTGFGEDYTEQARIIQSAAPDAVISVASYAAAAGFVRDSRDLAMNAPIANLSFVNSGRMLELLVEEGSSKGRDYSRNLVHCEVVPDPGDRTIPAARDFQNLLGADADRAGFVAFEGFLNARLVVEILRRRQQQHGQQPLRDILGEIRDWDIGLRERVTFEGDSNQGLQTVYFHQFRNGRFEEILDWPEWRRNVETF